MKQHNTLKNTYTAIVTGLNKELKALKSKSLFLSISRFTLIVLTAYFFYQSVAASFWLWPFAGVLVLATFLFLVKRHDALKQLIRLKRAQINQTHVELDYLEGQLSKSHSHGHEFSNPDHDYSHDLDVFGTGSLFHRVNRTFTKRGAERLAHKMLLTENLPEITAQQTALAELSGHTEWNLKFRGYGELLEDDDLLELKIETWLKQAQPNSWLTSKFLLYPLAMVTFGLLSNWLYHPTAQHFYWLLYAFAGNVFITFLNAGSIKTQYAALNNLSAPLFGLSQILKPIESSHFTSPLLVKILGNIKNHKTKASQALYKLGKIVNAFDQLNNPVALFFLNGLMHYHLHALNRLSKWKKTNNTEITSWLKTVSELEAQISMATYAANHPHYQYPQISTTPCFEAQGLGHPLISENKAVCNDLNINHWRYAILTGSNMSGKSTFLKTVGLNILLAQMGLPVFANSLKLYPFRLLTSMKLVDSINKEESYFQAEVLRLKRIKESLGAQRPAFLLLDEILRGTNSEDKRLGTRKFMEQLKTGKDFGILATHDIDVAQLSEKHPQIFKALYFESKVVNSQLTFDFKLRMGVCTTPNATDLMRSYGII